MITVLKLASLSAVLSAGLVAGLDGGNPVARAPLAKPFQDRLGEVAAASLASPVGALVSSAVVQRSRKADRYLGEARPSVAQAAAEVRAEPDALTTVTRRGNAPVTAWR